MSEKYPLRFAVAVSLSYSLILHSVLHSVMLIAIVNNVFPLHSALASTPAYNTAFLLCHVSLHLPTPCTEVSTQRHSGGSHATHIAASLSRSPRNGDPRTYRSCALLGCGIPDNPGSIGDIPG